MQAIQTEQLKKWNETYRKDRSVRTLQAAMAKTELADLAYVPGDAAKLNGAFSIELKTRGITAQMKSGRCWMFAAMNIMREIVAEKCGLQEFELSGNYLAFYDKLEKANNYLEMAIASADKPVEDPMFQYLAKGIGDGGYFCMAVDLVKKYGVVPKSVMPETYQSTHTEKFMRLLNSLLRKDAAELRKRIRNGEDVTARKEEMLEEIYKAEAIVFGIPTERFDFGYRNAQGEYHCDTQITPKEFYDRYIGMELDQYVRVTNEPTETKEFYQTYIFHYVGSMAESDVTSLNLPIQEVKELCLKQLKDQEPVWFACDSGQYGDRKLGIWDPDSFDYEGLLGGVDLRMDKGERMLHRESFGTHAMILVGANVKEDGQPDRYKIENSWGKEAGQDGYFVCSDRYFDEFVYEAIIHRKHFNKQQQAAMEKEPIRVQPWLV